jgi:hypothetical protein
METVVSLLAMFLRMVLSEKKPGGWTALLVVSMVTLIPMVKEENSPMLAVSPVMARITNKNSTIKALKLKMMRIQFKKIQLTQQTDLDKQMLYN